MGWEKSFCVQLVYRVLTRVCLSLMLLPLVFLSEVCVCVRALREEVLRAGPALAPHSVCTFAGRQQQGKQTEKSMWIFEERLPSF